MENLPLYKLVIDEEAIGMDYMGLVDYPAHGKNWVAFKKEAPVQKEAFKQHFNEERKIVTGVAIATNLQIYRRREDGTEYRVYFTAEDVVKIAQELFKNNYMHNVNEMHDLNKDVADMFLFESYFINADKSNIPASFEGQNLQPGSWIVSYKVENPDTWEKIKNGDFVGFSIEGWFKEVEVNIKKVKQNKTKNMSLLEKLGLKKESLKFDKEKHGEAVAVDGTQLAWEGDAPAEGEALFILDAESGELILAAAGEYAFPFDGSDWVATVDEAGLIVSLVQAEAEEEEMGDKEKEEQADEVLEAMKGLQADYERKLAELTASLDERFTKVAEAFDKMSDKFEDAMDPEKKAKEETFKGTPKPGWKKKK